MLNATRQLSGFKFDKVIIGKLRYKLHGLEKPLILDIGCGDTTLGTSLVDLMPEETTYIGVDTDCPYEEQTTGKSVYATSDIEFYRPKLFEAGGYILFLAEVVHGRQDVNGFFQHLQEVYSKINPNCKGILIHEKYRSPQLLDEFYRDEGRWSRNKTWEDLEHAIDQAIFELYKFRYVTRAVVSDISYLKFYEGAHKYEEQDNG